MTTSDPAATPHSLLAHFRDLPDPRVKRTLAHDLIDVLIIAICTLLCGREGFNDMADFGRAKRDWFQTFLTLRNGIPSQDTFNRVLAAIDSKAFLDCFLRWTARRCAGLCSRTKAASTSSVPGPRATAWCWAS